MRKALDIDTYISDALSIMDTYGPDHEVDLIVDEWGTFYQCEWGVGEERFWGYDGEYMAFQQNTLRDALTAASTLNIYNRRSDRIHMANLSMTVNQLQSLILTQDENMVLTPTYHVFDLYQDHQDSMLVDSQLQCEDYTWGGSSIPVLNSSVSKNREGFLTVSLCNLDPNNTANLQCELENWNVTKITGKKLTSHSINDHNTYEQPANVVPAAYTDFELQGNSIKLSLDPKSITVLKIY